MCGVDVACLLFVVDDGVVVVVVLSVGEVLVVDV